VGLYLDNIQNVWILTRMKMQGEAIASGKNDEIIHGKWSLLTDL